jgi:hypothetical protein
MAFPASAYTARGGVGSTERAARIAVAEEPVAETEDADVEDDEAEANVDANTDHALPDAA